MKIYSRQSNLASSTSTTRSRTRPKTERRFLLFTEIPLYVLHSPKSSLSYGLCGSAMFKLTKGAFQSKLVLTTFARHLALTADSMVDYGTPKGALALSTAAVRQLLLLICFFSCPHIFACRWNEHSRFGKKARKHLHPASATKGGVLLPARSPTRSTESKRINGYTSLTRPLSSAPHYRSLLRMRMIPVV